MFQSFQLILDTRLADEIAAQISHEGEEFAILTIVETIAIDGVDVATFARLAAESVRVGGHIVTGRPLIGGAINERWIGDGGRILSGDAESADLIVAEEHFDAISVASIVQSRIAANAIVANVGTDLIDRLAAIGNRARSRTGGRYGCFQAQMFKDVAKAESSAVTGSVVTGSVVTRSVVVSFVMLVTIAAVLVRGASNRGVGLRRGRTTRMRGTRGRWRTTTDRHSRHQSHQHQDRDQFRHFGLNFLNFDFKKISNFLDRC